MERYLSHDLGRGNRRVRLGMEESKLIRGILKTIGVLAVSMIMSDGVLTPGTAFND